MIPGLIIIIVIIAIIGIVYFSKKNKAKKEVKEAKEVKKVKEVKEAKEVKEVTPVLAPEASIIKGILNTEKTTGLKERDNKYAFKVDKNANKIEIKNAVESLYKVKVIKVNTSIAHGKKRRVRFAIGQRPDWKKAIVTLRVGDRIESLESK